MMLRSESSGSASEPLRPWQHHEQHHHHPHHHHPHLQQPQQQHQQYPPDMAAAPSELPQLRFQHDMHGVSGGRFGPLAMGKAGGMFPPAQQQLAPAHEPEMHAAQSAEPRDAVADMFSPAGLPSAPYDSPHHALSSTNSSSFASYLSSPEAAVHLPIGPPHFLMYNAPVGGPPMHHSASMRGPLGPAPPPPAGPASAFGLGLPASISMPTTRLPSADNLGALRSFQRTGSLGSASSHESPEMATADAPAEQQQHQQPSSSQSQTGSAAAVTASEESDSSSLARRASPAVADDAKQAAESDSAATSAESANSRTESDADRRSLRSESSAPLPQQQQQLSFGPTSPDFSRFSAGTELRRDSSPTAAAGDSAPTSSALAPSLSRANSQPVVSHAGHHHAPPQPLHIETRNLDAELQAAFEERLTLGLPQDRPLSLQRQSSLPSLAQVNGSINPWSPTSTRMDTMQQTQAQIPPQQRDYYAPGVQGYGHPDEYQQRVQSNLGSPDAYHPQYPGADYGQDPSMYYTTGGGGYGDAATAYQGAPVAAAKSDRVCRYILEGYCARGDSCMFAHSDPNLRAGAGASAVAYAADPSPKAHYASLAHRRGSQSSSSGGSSRHPLSPHAATMVSSSTSPHHPYAHLSPPSPSNAMGPSFGVRYSQQQQRVAATPPNGPAHVQPGRFGPLEHSYSQQQQQQFSPESHPSGPSWSPQYQQASMHVSARGLPPGDPGMLAMGGSGGYLGHGHGHGLRTSPQSSRAQYQQQQSQQLPRPHAHVQQQHYAAQGVAMRQQQPPAYGGMAGHGLGLAGPPSDGYGGLAAGLQSAAAAAAAAVNSGFPDYSGAMGGTVPGLKHGRHGGSGGGSSGGIVPTAKADMEARFAGLDLDAVRGQFPVLAKDQHGCRFLQRKLEEGGPSAATAILDEILERFADLMTDPFGNYLCQKLLDHVNDDQKVAILEHVGPHLPSVSLNMHGTRAVQKLVEHIGTADQAALLVRALTRHTVTLIKDLNGNHVIQKCLVRLAPPDAQFIYDAVTHQCVEVSTHRHGCCVIQRCLDYASNDQRRRLAAEITGHSLLLVKDPFGNYVVQYVLDMGETTFVDGIAARMRGHVALLSMQKFASNVMEKCIRVASPDLRQALISEIYHQDVLAKLLRDAFGNFVVQTSIDYTSGDQRALLMEHLAPLIPLIRNTPYGKRIMSKLNLAY
ncbi:hypothetical protein H9P43_001725 [Blastocladiella emersonii ATCC 22665]|nr:hypothetical protein H9P43_001725 [Blastocladiella emersonii ATCC 22665]